jgi:acyl-homoserine-lactone acylase
MRARLFACVLLFAACSSATSVNPEIARWEAQAERVTITRDNWGIAHVYGPTDADAIFGMIYAQAEDDFNRIEVNYLKSMGRLAEAEGEQAIWSDLRMRLFIDSMEMKEQFEESPAWLRQLMRAWADGLNYYLHTHPEVKPRVIARFEPWMPLTFSEGSIGGDIEQIPLARLQAFYGDTARAAAQLSGGEGEGLDRFDRAGSNGFAIAPANTVNGRALLLINPHTSFFFRSELQVTSDEGLNAYGAATWGQFFIYQGFNERAGWMHTTSGADNQDEFAVTVSRRDSSWVYRYGAEERPVLARAVTIRYRTPVGDSARSFTVYRTHHGPVVGEEGGRWIAAQLMHEPVNALTQSYLRTKAQTLAEFRETMELHTNSSNNTVYADADGHIAYFHANFVPIRDVRFDWTKPVDGNDPATAWQGVHGVEESPLVIDPVNGWIQNTNNWPFSAAGAASPKREDFPRYMDTYSENPRGVNAVRVLSAHREFTLDRLRDAAYDSYQPAFAVLVPMLLAAYDALPASDPRRRQLGEPAAALRGWDYRWSEHSVPTTLAVYWGDELFRIVPRGTAGTPGTPTLRDGIPTGISAERQLDAFAAAIDTLTATFGSWKMPWGEVNRFQRITSDILHPFDDAQPSLPVPFTTGRYGSLASFGTSTVAKTKKRYGTGGNSFVAVVEFGDSVRARAVSAGGESGDPASKHFNDQAALYAAGQLREVYFYPNQLEGRVERRYRPGR